MLDKLVEFFLHEVAELVRKKTVPKSRAMRMLMEIYNAMVDCQEAYIDFIKRVEKPVRKRGLGNILDSDEYGEWRLRVRELDEVLSLVERKLEIAAPDVFVSVRQYFAAEVERSQAPVYRSVMARYLIPDADTQVGRKPIQQELLEERALKSFDGFEQAIEPLRKFLREHYSWDELLS